MDLMLLCHVFVTEVHFDLPGCCRIDFVCLFLYLLFFFYIGVTSCILLHLQMLPSLFIRPTSGLQKMILDHILNNSQKANQVLFAQPQRVLRRSSSKIKGVFSLNRTFFIFWQNYSMRFRSITLEISTFEDGFHGNYETKNKE